MSTRTISEAPHRRAASSRHWQMKSGLPSVYEWQYLEYIKDQVDVAWRRFWAKRGYENPPYISDRTIGVFDLPHQKRSGWNMRFGKGMGHTRQP
jgi:hypothetical protein